MCNEQDYMQGNRAAWLTMLQTCIRQLGVADVEAGKVQWILERVQTVAALREVCKHHGDSDWDEALHLADVVDKHLMRHLEAVESRPSIINQCDYIDVAELPEDAKQAYKEYVIAVGLNNGEHYSYTIGDDSVVESYIGEKQRRIIDDALIAAGLRDNSIIDLVFSW